MFETPNSLSYDQLSRPELDQELARVTAQDKAQNGPVFPVGSLHYRGVLCISCELCRRRTYLLYKLGRRASSTIRPGEMPTKLERSFERRTPPEAVVNNLYDIEMRGGTRDESSDEEASKV